MSKEATIWIVIAIYAIFMVVIGVVNSKNSGGMASFTVGGRNAGAWISALSYGTAYFSAVMFIGYSGGSGWSYGLYATLVELEMRCSVPSWRGWCWQGAPERSRGVSKSNPCPSSLKCGIRATA